MQTLQRKEFRRRLQAIVEIGPTVSADQVMQLANMPHGATTLGVASDG